MLVIATHLGYYKDSRRRIGVEFEMDEKDMKQKDGKPVLPKWVVEATPENRAGVRRAHDVERKRGLEAVQAASGPKRHPRQLPKQQDGSELV